MMYQKSFVHPAQSRWAQIEDGVEKGDWDGQGKATERELGNIGYALYGMKSIEINFCQYVSSLPIREKTHLN